MKSPVKYFNRKKSRTYSMRAENRKRRLLERRKKLGRPIDKAKSRREFWKGYSSEIQNASAGLEDGFYANGGFEDRLEAQQEHFQNLPFRSVARYLSDSIFSYMKRLPLSNGVGIQTMQPKGYRYAGTIPTAEKENFMACFFKEEMEEIRMVEVPEAVHSGLTRINIYVDKGFTELKKGVKEIVNVANENYGWDGRRIEENIPLIIGGREKNVLLNELKPTLSKEQRKILEKAYTIRIENIVY